mmetsp:Transcript_34884/g.44980  ORF Transcript_34884/g.44980 Transcript_34884/m.44980 type:complete len:167 (-) Transcript_34884:359-859(-)
MIDFSFSDDFNFSVSISFINVSFNSLIFLVCCFSMTSMVNSCLLISSDCLAVIDDCPPPPPPPPPSPSNSSSPPLSVSSSFSGKNTGSKNTLELIWSEGFSHGEIVLSTARQHEIFKRMFIQECRIFAEGQGGGKSSSSLGQGRHQKKSHSDYEDDLHEEPVVRCC